MTVLTRVAVNETLDTNQNPRPARSILERVDPLAVLVCLLDTHPIIVVYKLLCRAETPWPSLKTLDRAAAALGKRLVSRATQ